MTSPKHCRPKAAPNGIEPGTNRPRPTRVAAFVTTSAFERGYRAVYTVRFEKAVYVLHAFQKKSPSGIRTAKRDVDLVAERLKAAERDHEEYYGKQKR